MATGTQDWRGQDSGKYVRAAAAAAAASSRRARGIAPLHSWRILRSSPTVNDSRDVRSSSLLAAAPTRRIMSIVAASVAGLRTYV
jgi:hypothetical protein